VRLGAAIGMLVNERAWELPAAGASLRERWEAIAPEFAGHVAAVGYDADPVGSRPLAIGTAGSSAMNLMAVAAPEFLASLASALVLAAVRRVVWVAWPVGPSTADR
jgi:hypothetical protein